MRGSNIKKKSCTPKCTIQIECTAEQATTYFGGSALKTTCLCNILSRNCFSTKLAPKLASTCKQSCNLLYIIYSHAITKTSEFQISNKASLYTLVIAIYQERLGSIGCLRKQNGMPISLSCSSLRLLVNHSPYILWNTFRKLQYALGKV